MDAMEGRERDGGDGWSAPQKVMLLLKGRASRRGMDSVITSELKLDLVNDLDHNS